MARTRRKQVSDSAEPTAVVDTSFSPVEIERQQQASDIVHGLSEATRLPDDRPAAHEHGHSHAERHPPRERVIQSGLTTKERDEVAGVKRMEGFRLNYGRKIEEAIIAFKDKPPPEVTKAMYEANFRWNPQEKFWVYTIGHASGSQDRLHAERTFDQVSKQLRELQGVGQAVG